MFTYAANIAFCIIIVFSMNSLANENSFSYKIQKYSGFTLANKLLAEFISESYIRIKSKAKKVDIKIEPYSGVDLIRKKAKKITLKANEIRLKEIPIDSFYFETKNPITLGKDSRGKIWVQTPVNIKSICKIDLSDSETILDGFSEIKKVGKEKDSTDIEVELPLPPFGTTKLLIQDIDLKISLEGKANIIAYIRSAINPKEEPLKVEASGELVLDKKKIKIGNVKTSVQDIFTEDSEEGKQFSSFIEDLINPIFNFAKLEKKGITIDSVNLEFNKGYMIIKLDGLLNPREDT